MGQTCIAQTYKDIVIINADKVEYIAVQTSAGKHEQLGETGQVSYCVGEVEC